LAAGTIPHLVDFGLLWPPSCFPTDKDDFFYPVSAPVTLLSGNGGSSSLHIGKYIIEVLEVFHKKSANSWQLVHLLFSVTIVWAFHSDIVDEYFRDCSQVSV
jgi:hypothetical protein